MDSASDSKAVDCASDELSDTMCDPFGVVGLIYKTKVRSYIAILYSRLIIVCCVLKMTSGDI